PPPPPAAPPAPAAAAPAPAEAPLPVATLPDTGIDGSSQTRSWLIMMGLGLAGAVLIWRVQRKRQAQDLAQQPLPPPQVDQEPSDQETTAPDSD
ncbi:MAG: LPXTG cell wall anchor domain-containing protein, partial [Anaerolineae bacterium]|nr:LPXTG cell wall anchor domain-containing protein [Anaerolineae bacterium]